MSSHSTEFPFLPPSGSSPTFLRRCIDSQVRLSAAFDRLIPAELTVDGNQEFKRHLVPAHLRKAWLVYDVGGGKHPSVALDRKQELGLRIVGLDISTAELKSAPPGSYDEEICADVTRYRGRADGDLVISDALLEHVSDTGAALRAIASVLKPGGLALLFIPSRYALYAVLNLLLPQTWKRWLLFRIFPGSEAAQGFRAFYDRCTPREVAGLARENGMAVEALMTYYHSPYFTCSFPLHALWRMWQLLFRRIAGDQAAETFSVVLRKIG